MVIIVELKEIWAYFTDRMTEIELYRYAADKTAKTELKLIEQSTEQLKKHPDSRRLPASLHNMAFKDAESGNHVFYGHKDLSLREMRLRAVLHKNKQYLWLLAEAYEEFEDYLEKIYTYCGATDNSFWPLKDYGNITLSELSEKDYSWFYNQVKCKKEKPHSILNHFRKQYPELKEKEINNQTGMNLKLTIFMIEHMRHIIVHKKGLVDNKDDFIRNVTRKAGVINNGNISPEHLDYINLYFGTGDYSNMIILLEFQVPSEIPLPIYHNRLGVLLERLIAYSYLLYQHVYSAMADDVE